MAVPAVRIRNFSTSSSVRLVEHSSPLASGRSIPIRMAATTTVFERVLKNFMRHMEMAIECDK